MFRYIDNVLYIDNVWKLYEFFNFKIIMRTEMNNLFILCQFLHFFNFRKNKVLLKSDNFVRRRSKTFSGANVEVICEQLLYQFGILEIITCLYYRCKLHLKSIRLVLLYHFYK